MPEETAPRRSRAREAELRWLAENEAIIERRYAGQWIAVQGDRLVAASGSLDAVLNAAKEKGAADPLVTAVKRKDLQGMILIRPLVEAT
jgi:hypothetical protein